MRIRYIGFAPVEEWHVIARGWYALLVIVLAVLGMWKAIELVVRAA